MSQLVQYQFSNSLYSFTLDGWFNATEAAAQFGKLPNDWLRLPETAAYLEAFQRRYGKIPHVKTSRARADRGGGTWLHPKLAVRFAQWLSDDFGVWCDEQIDTILRGQIQARGNPDLIGLYLRPDAAPWEKRFPDDYYRALAHITRTDYTGHIGGTPAVFGQLTERWVYAVILPADVHEELRTRHGESQKMHQWLSNGGADLLDKQIQVVATIARTSSDLRDFTARMMALPGTGLYLPHGAGKDRGMNYYQHHIGDYAAATAYLSLIEDAIYTRLLRVYYRDEKPLPADTKAVAWLIGLRSKKEVALLDNLLPQFFTMQADGWHNLRADEEIGHYQSNRETAQENGKKGGRPKSKGKPSDNPDETKGKPEENPDETQKKPNPNPEITQAKPNSKLTNNQYI